MSVELVCYVKTNIIYIYIYIYIYIFVNFETSFVGGICWLTDCVTIIFFNLCNTATFET